jgi:hypothetical protein
MPALCDGKGIHMELVFEIEWNGNSVMLDRLNSFRRGTAEAASGHMHGVLETNCREADRVEADQNTG